MVDPRSAEDSTMLPTLFVQDSQSRWDLFNLIEGLFILVSQLLQAQLSLFVLCFSFPFVRVYISLEQHVNSYVMRAESYYKFC